MPKKTDICKECGNEYSMHSTDGARCPKNGGWPIGGGELKFFSTHFDDGLYGVDQLRAHIATLEAENARLTAAHAMQGEELVTLPRQMVYSMEDKMKKQAAEIIALKKACIVYHNQIINMQKEVEE